MNKIFILQIIFFCFYLNVADAKNKTRKNSGSIPDSLNNTSTEPYLYHENFEDRNLGAWASYPQWQDLAYDQNFRVNEMVPGDPNISLVQMVTPYTNVDNYAGAQKLVNMFLVPGSKLTLRYYLKTNLAPESFKIRFAAGVLGKIDVTILKPLTNKWVWVTVSFRDFVRENPILANKKKVEVFALAVLAKIPRADPAMPIYLGLDDISFNGVRATPFRFVEPIMYKLPEFNQYIPNKHYYSGDTFKLRGQWVEGANKVSVEIFPFTDLKNSVYKSELTKTGKLWSLGSLQLLFPEGLYIAKMSAFNGITKLSSTEFTIHIAPKNIGGKHPRLLFDSAGKNLIKKRFSQDGFKGLFIDILKNAKVLRGKIPIESLVFDLDQYPDEDWLPTWSAWGSHIYNTGEAIHLNALTYAFDGDIVAGKYAKEMLLKLSEWPTWTHPWMIKRGKFGDHRSGSWSHRLAEAYDLTYDLMNEHERNLIRKALMKNIIENVHKSYVYNDDITGNTSNWIAATVGGSLMNMAAIFGDGPKPENIEPFFTGAMLKFYTFLNRVSDSADGSWGEGLGYNSYSFQNMSYSVPSLFNVFNIDVTAPLVNTYNEFIWGGIIKEKKWFEYGDSGGDLGPTSNWAFLLNMRKAPRLNWFYNYLKKENTFEDVMFGTNKVPIDSPFSENPVKVFRKTGTTVFKSGWDKNDMVFTMRTGAFFNHQHLDQGSFWFADRGVTFIEERPLHNSNYYDDPLYQSHLIQPVGHSTIIIDNNEQSQRTGDELEFAPGFDDHAFITQFLDGKEAAFSRGDIGRLYWGKVKSLSRNLLFIKPRTILMLDEVVPANKNVDVTLLYQTEHLKDITPGDTHSTITKEGVTLHVLHLAPDSVRARAVETPHYLKTLQNVKPLEREGMLTLSAVTKGKPLVMANILTTAMSGNSPEVTTTKGNGFISGIVSGRKFAFSTRPGNIYKVENLETDGLSITWNNSRYFVAMSTVLRRDGKIVLETEQPVTFEFSGDGIKYYHESGGKLTIGCALKPSLVMLNGKAVKDFLYNQQRKVVILGVPKGEGSIIIK